MVNFNEIEDVDEGTTLVDERSPQSEQEEGGEVLLTILPVSPSPTPKMQLYFESLKSLTLSDLRDLYEIESDKIRPFAQEVGAADLAVWLKKPFLSLEEAVALSFGREPSAANIKSLDLYKDSPFVKEFRSRLDSLDRYAKSKALSGLKPSQFSTWLKEMKIDNSALASHGVEIGRMGDNASASPEMHHHTLDCYYKVLIAFCATNFGYEPFTDSTNNRSIAAKVGKCLSSYNRDFAISEKTLKKHLRDAEAHFGRDGVLKRKS
ncbi:hypothetical protein NKI80_25235 [Mesorhizobium sp. M0387]|uniref:hypothetical protein n=1 Tax=Mesorhizobium sp. M0387 TaxID=2956940 RepID=UPI003338974A